MSILSQCLHVIIRFCVVDVQIYLYNVVLLQAIQNIRICCIDITIAWGYVSHLIDYYVERIVLAGIQG